VSQQKRIDDKQRFAFYVSGELIRANALIKQSEPRRRKSLMADQQEPRALSRLAGYESWLYTMPRMERAGDVLVSVPLDGRARRELEGKRARSGLEGARRTCNAAGPRRNRSDGRCSQTNGDMPVRRVTQLN
jgi:hypothetical protein